jgi:hypothetical protein
MAYQKKRQSSHGREVNIGCPEPFRGIASPTSREKPA